MNGLLLVNKPSGWTSFDVVAKVRGVIRAANRQANYEASNPGSIVTMTGGTTSLPKRVKVGHTGTLDPLATGLLVLLIGNYTKRAPELARLDKTYEATMKLGETSTTGDGEGQKTVFQRHAGEPDPVVEELQQALVEYTGDIMQTPPIFSAMKINGQRAYKLAREGKEVKLEPRPATIYSMSLTVYNYPFVKFTAEVSSGTYIRSLVEDLGGRLGTGAYMSDLRRTRVGEYRLDDSIDVDDLTSSLIATNLRQLPN